MKGLTFIVAIGLASTAAGASAASPERAFDRLDSNADGRLSREEAAAHSAIAQRFQQLDANKDGSLSRDELASKRRSVCDTSEVEGQGVKTQSHSPRRTTFVAE